jgi:cytochrome c oxidase assembly factor CtaG
MPPDVGWTLDPAVIVALVTYAGLYVWRFRAARREAGGRGAGPARALAAAGALLALVVALLTPLDALGERYLFSAHMAQHVLLGDIAPALVLLGLSRVIMRPATRRLLRLERAVGPLAHPVTALATWLLLIYGWHVPALYQAALRDPLVHALEHASFFTAGIVVWWPLVGPVPMRRRLHGLWTFAYIGTAKLGLGALGLYFTWSSTVAYPLYAEAPRLWGLSAIDDQNAGGAIMMFEQSIVLAIALVALFVRMLTQSEEEDRRRERLEEVAAL